MNIFHLSLDLEKSARYHCDKHICKMLIEYAQLLSTANRLSGVDEGYKKTHINHPCSIWARKSLENWIYIKDLAGFCNKEFRYRYNHTVNHKSYDVILSLSTPNLPSLGLTKPPICMPEEVKMSSVVGSYRNYYKLNKVLFAKWTNRKTPGFMF